MATQFPSPAAVPRRELKDPLFFFTEKMPCRTEHLPRKCDGTMMRTSRIRAANGGGESYLDMWRKAVDRERKAAEFEWAADRIPAGDESGEVLERRNRDFEKLLEVPLEERDRAQGMQVLDRAAAAISAAKALLEENIRPEEEVIGDQVEDQKGTDASFLPQPGSSDTSTPGPSFWAWAPPPLPDDDILVENELKRAHQPSLSPSQSIPVLETEQHGPHILPIPFETSVVQSRNGPPLPPLQSLVEVEILKTTSQETPHLKEEAEIEAWFSGSAAETANALNKVDEGSKEGVGVNESRWWKETGIERRPDGVLCKWTLMRGVGGDDGVEWENKYWEAADEFGYKELGSEKSGRDASGNVWREYWRQSMMKIEGLVHFEKTADKWGKNSQGDEWHEIWWEHYDDSGKAEKWAHKWCSIDPNTPLEAGHAHVWHERWGKNFDGQGGCVSYTDKWAERFEGDGWAKWGDKWDENFDQDGRGVKQGESWWEGKYGDRWNQTWGEGHNGSGWVHKYGKSSSGEHWDTHVQQDTWYERFSNFGFDHCFENSARLRDVEKPSAWLVEG